MTIALGSLGLVKFLLERTDRATDVLLELEDHFEKCIPGREYVSVDSKYEELKKVLAVEASAPSYELAQQSLDALLRFYVVLVNVRRARQVPDEQLSSSYGYWLAQYYRDDRAELRAYVDQYFRTLRNWLVGDGWWFSRFWWRPSATFRPFFTDSVRFNATRSQRLSAAWNVHEQREQKKG